MFSDLELRLGLCTSQKFVTFHYATGHHNCSSAGVHRDAVWGMRGSWMSLPWFWRYGGEEMPYKIHENPNRFSRMLVKQSLRWSLPGIFWDCKMHSSQSCIGKKVSFAWIGPSARWKELNNPFQGLAVCFGQSPHRFSHAWGQITQPVISTRTSLWVFE